MKILKKGGEETKFMSHAPVVDNCLFSFIGYLIYSSLFFQTNNKCQVISQDPYSGILQN
jgi:hypothetical protein